MYLLHLPTHVLCPTVLGPTAADVVSDTADGADDNNDDDDATDAFGLVAEDHVLIKRQCTWDTTVQAALMRGTFFPDSNEQSYEHLTQQLEECLFHVPVPKSDRLPKVISGT